MRSPISEHSANEIGAELRQERECRESLVPNRAGVWNHTHTQDRFPHAAPHACHLPFPMHVRFEHSNPTTQPMASTEGGIRGNKICLAIHTNHPSSSPGNFAINF